MDVDVALGSGPLSRGGWVTSEDYLENEVCTSSAAVTYMHMQSDRLQHTGRYVPAERGEIKQRYALETPGQLCPVSLADIGSTK